MEVIEFLKYELRGWKKHEVIGLLIVFSIIMFNLFVLHDSKASAISAMSGILYTTMAGKGKISCYAVGLIGIFFYSYLSFKNALYGNLALYLCYYFPMQILGIFEWKKHLKKTTREIVKTCLTKKQIIIIASATTILCIAAISLISYLKGSNPIFDGITTVLSILGMYFTVKRYLEQWVVWMVVNSLSAIMWLNLILHGAKTYSTLVMWIVYCIIAVYFYILWRKEVQDEKNSMLRG